MHYQGYSRAPQLPCWVWMGPPSCPQSAAAELLTAAAGAAAAALPLAPALGCAAAPRSRCAVRLAAAVVCGRLATDFTRETRVCESRQAQDKMMSRLTIAAISQKEARTGADKSMARDYANFLTAQNAVDTAILESDRRVKPD